jgi:hypothetical protein
MFPEAPVYTAYAFPNYWGRYKEILEKWDIRQSWGRWLPFLPKFLSYYTILSPLFFRSFDLSGYDLVIISATGGYFPNAIKFGSKTKVITYCHTPPRFLYGYDTATKERYKWYWRPMSEIANHILRMVDFRTTQRPHLFIANSKNVANRIRKFYRREAIVVYPPIEIINNPPSSPPLNLRGGRGRFNLMFVSVPTYYKDKLLIRGMAEVKDQMVEPTHILNLGWDWIRKWKAAKAHKSQGLGKSAKMPLALFMAINHFEYYHLVSKENKYKFKMSGYQI